MRWLTSGVLGALIALSVFAGATASAQPAQPDPTITSSTDELTDMVMDVIEQDGAGPAILPTTTPVPVPAP